MEIVYEQRLLIAIDLVDGQEKWPICLPQQANEFEIGTGKLGTSIDNHDDGGGFVERDPRLTKNLGRNELPVCRQDAACIDDTQPTTVPLGIAIQPVASNAGFIADDGAA